LFKHIFVTVHSRGRLGKNDKIFLWGVKQRYEERNSSVKLEETRDEKRIWWNGFMTFLWFQFICDMEIGMEISDQPRWYCFPCLQSQIFSSASFIWYKQCIIWSRNNSLEFATLHTFSSIQKINLWIREYGKYYTMCHILRKEGIFKSKMDNVQKSYNRVLQPCTDYNSIT